MRRKFTWARAFLKIAVPLLLVMLLAYNFLLGSFFIRKVALPLCGRATGTELRAEDISFSLMHASLSVKNLMAGSSGTELLGVGSADFAWKWLPLIKGKLEVLKFHARDIEVSPLLALAGTATEQGEKKEVANSASEGVSQSTFALPFKDFLIKDVRIENFSFKFPLTKNDTSKEKFMTRLHLEKIEMKELRPDTDSILDVFGSAEIVCPSSCEVRGNFSNSISFRLSKKLLPETFNMNLIVDDLNGQVSGTPLEGKRLEMSLLSKMNEDGLVNVETFAISETACDGGEESLSKISASGSVRLEPFIAEADFDLKRASPELLALVLKVAGVELPGRLSLSSSGHISVSPESLKSAGVLNASHDYICDTKKILSETKCDFDISANFRDSSMKLKRLGLNLALNGNECVSLRLDKELALEWGEKTASENIPDSEMPVKLSVKSFSLPLANIFLDKNSGLKFTDGTLDADILVKVASRGARIGASGKVSSNDCSFIIGEDEFKNLSASIECSGISIDNFTKMTTNAIQAGVSKNGDVFAKFAGKIGMDFDELSGSAFLDRFCLNDGAKNALPANFADYIPFKTFSISGSLGAKWKKSFSEYYFDTNLTAEALDFDEKILYADFSDAKIALSVCGKGDLMNLSDVDAKMQILKFKCDKALADISVESRLNKLDFIAPRLEADSLSATISMESGGKAYLKTNRAFALDFSKDPLELSPPLEGILEIKDFPLKSMHDFFDESAAFSATEGNAEQIGIYFKFGDDFNLDMAQLDLKARNFSFSSAGTKYKVPELEFSGNAIFDGWTRLAVSNAMTTVKKMSGENILQLANDASFNFSSGKGKIATEILELNEKLLEIMPEKLLESVSALKQFSASGSKNIFSYSIDGFETSGNLKAQNLRIETDRQPPASANVDYKIKSHNNDLQVEKLDVELKSSGNLVLALNSKGLISPSANKYHISLNSEYCDAAFIQALFSKNGNVEETMSADVSGSKKSKTETGKTSFYDLYDIDLTASMKKVKYGESMDAAIDSRILIGGGLIKIPFLKGIVNDAPIQGHCEADLRDADAYSYDLVFETGAFELGPMVSPLIQSKNPFAARVKELRLEATSKNANSENILRDICGSFRAEFENISIPNTLREKSIIVNLIMTPIETIATLGKYIPEKFIPKELSSVAETFTVYFRNFDNFEFKSAIMKAKADLGKINLEECRLNGEAINFLLLKGMMDANARILDISSETKIGKIVIPLKIRGSFDKPSPDYKSMLIDFIAQNTANLANPENISEILSITRDKGTSVGEKTIKIIENLLGGKNDDKKKNSQDRYKQEPSPETNDGKELDNIMKLFKKKKPKAK